MNVGCIMIRYKSSAKIYESHLHDHYEMYFVLSDNVTIRTENGVYMAKRGDFFVFAPFSFHKITADGNVFERCMMFVDSNAMLKEASFLRRGFALLENEKCARFTIAEDKIEYIKELFLRGERAVCEHNENTDYEIVIIMCELFKIIAASHRDDNVTVKRNNRIAVILKYVSENAEYGITVSDVAEKFGIGTTTLHMIFKANLGISPGEYILRFKLNRSIELLSEGVSVTEAANRAGFNSYSHFIRIFKKRIGTPPHSFIKNY